MKGMVFAVCSLCLGAGYGLTPDAAWGDELYAADLRGELWRYGTVAESRTRIGRLPAALVGLDVATDGSLIGLAEDRRIWRIDAATGRSVLVAGAGEASFRYFDVVELAPNDLLLLRQEAAFLSVELSRLDLMTGIEQELGVVEHDNDGLPQPLEFLAMAKIGSEIYLSGIDRVLRLELEQMMAFETFIWRVAAADFVSSGDLFWALADIADGEARPRLLARGALGEPVPGRPVYEFPLGIGPRAIAFRSASSDCRANHQTLCLRDERFQLQVEWRDFEDRRGVGEAVIDRSRSAGQFWFFTPDNRELMVKVLDGCAINQRHWVFVSGTTNVEVVMTVTDLSTGAVKRYRNELGDVFETRLDTDAFMGCSASAQVAGGLQ